uniref:Uncharacterized protein n=1 Tax=Anguilla anguilla TaxID=7936 RepID=A0A0E9VHU6_ANGAN
MKQTICIYSTECFMVIRLFARRTWLSVFTARWGWDS